MSELSRFDDDNEIALAWSAMNRPCNIHDLKYNALPLCVGGAAAFFANQAGFQDTAIGLMLGGALIAGLSAKFLPYLHFKVPVFMAFKNSGDFEVIRQGNTESVPIKEIAAFELQKLTDYDQYWGEYVAAAKPEDRNNLHYTSLARAFVLFAMLTDGRRVLVSAGCDGVQDWLQRIAAVKNAHGEALRVLESHT